MRAYDEDTIAAISTPLGEGGIGIVRLSGPAAVAIVQGIFRSTRCPDLRVAPTHALQHGYILQPETNAVLDEVLVSVMRAPHSYTREDVVEINCHGGLLPLRNILDSVLRRGARLASPGEFTKRAFLNGRIDLAQAEAVIDLIRAKTQAGLQLAAQQLQGKLSARVHGLHRRLKHLAATIEAAIDFPEDDIDLISPAQIAAESDEMLAQLDLLLASAAEGKMVRDGLGVVIAGKPNVGKSSLLNVLLEEERALVTPIPGTTRDTIEEYINLQGVPIRLIDTAGLRETADPLERLGVGRSREAIAQADLVLALFDAAAPWTREDTELLQAIAGKAMLAVLNKMDLPIILSASAVAAQLPETVPVLPLSLKNQNGLDQVKQALVAQVLTAPLESVEVTNSRHKQALTLARQSLAQAREAARARMSLEFIALDFREALHHLGTITGETTTEDLLTEIFATFCIGK